MIARSLGLVTRKGPPDMIRMVIGLFVFAVLLCAWIVADPFGGEDEAPARRTEAPPSAETDAVEEAVARALGDAASGTGEEPSSVEVTRSVPEAPPDQPSMRTITRVFAEPAILTDDHSLAETTAGILAGLGFDTRDDLERATDDPLAAMTVGALSSIRTVTSVRPPVAEEPTPLQALIIEALNEGQTDAAIDLAVNDAARAGRIAVPDALVTSDGRVDTGVLLTSLVSEAREAAGEVVEAPDLTSGGDGVEVRVVQRAEETAQYRFYTVNSGDSLGAIAIKFYGDAQHYDVIFEANRSFLASPDQIRIGQRLAIPDIE